MRSYEIAIAENSRGEIFRTGSPEQRRTKDWYELNRASAKLPGFPGIA